MITANVQPEPDGRCLIRFDIPFKGKIKHEEMYAGSVAEAWRKVYFRLRKYICQTLIAWLHQRHHAITPFPKLPLYAERLAIINELLMLLEYYQTSSCRHLGNMINRESSKFLFLSPSINGRHYSYFQNTIKPIINFCSQQNHN